MSRVAVKESVLRWALDRSNTSADALRARFPKIGEWLDGITQPTFKQLEQLAAATTTPFGMLFLDTPPEEKLPIPHYRTLTDKAVTRPSVDLLDTIQTMQFRQDWMRDYRVGAGHQPLAFVNSAKLPENINSIAGRMRAVLGFDLTWASNYGSWEDSLRALRDAMERVGILVVANGIVGNNTHRVLDADEFRGFVLADNYAPLVFVNAADPKAAQMFTLAHELAHVFFGSSAAFDLRHTEAAASNKIEVACNRVAAEFLVPESEIRRMRLAVDNNWKSAIGKLGKTFKVSDIVVARRLLDLSIIDRKKFFEFYAMFMARIKSMPPSTGGDFYAPQSLRVGASIGAAVVQSLRDGRITYSEAFSLTGLRGNTFETFASTIEA